MYIVHRTHYTHSTPPRAPQGGTTSTTDVDPIDLVAVLPATILLVLLFRQRHQLSVRHRPRRVKPVWIVRAVLLLVVSGLLTGVWAGISRATAVRGLDGVPAGRTEVTGETLRRCGDDGVLLLMREAWGVAVPVREMARNHRLIDPPSLSPFVPRVGQACSPVLRTRRGPGRTVSTRRASDRKSGVSRGTR